MAKGLGAGVTKGDTRHLDYSSNNNQYYAPRDSL